MTYKRGISSAFIFCLNFSLNNEKLISSSDTGTLHIFDLKQEEEEHDKQPKGVTKFFNRAFVTVAAKLMPQDYEDTFGTQGASLVYNGDILKMSNLVSFNPKNPNEAFCFTSDGTFYLFWINYEKKQISKYYERNMKDLKIVN